MRVLVDCRMMCNGFMHGLARSDYMTVKAMARLQPEWEFGCLVCGDVVGDLQKECPNVSTVMTGAKPFTLREHFELPKVLSDWNPAVFHATSIAVPCRIPVRYVITVPDLTIYHHPIRFFDRWYFRLILKPVLNRAKLVAVSCQHCVDDVHKTMGVPLDKLLLISQGVDREVYEDFSAEETAELKKKHGLDEHYVLCVSNPKPHKNLPRLLEAWKKLKQECENEEFISFTDGKGFTGRDLQLVVVSNMQHNLQSWLDELPKLQIVSRVSDRELGFLYQHSEFLAFPSLSEGFGLPVLESLKADRPVCVSGNTSLPEVAGEAGVIFNPYSPDDIRGAMLKLLRDGELYKRLQSHCQAQLSKFSWEKTAQLQIDMYRRAVEL